MFKPFAKSLLAAVAVAGLALPSAWAKEAEVLHWWTSGGEAAALKVLKDDFGSNGGTWKDLLQVLPWSVLKRIEAFEIVPDCL